MPGAVLSARAADFANRRRLPAADASTAHPVSVGMYPGRLRRAVAAHGHDRGDDRDQHEEPEHGRDDVDHAVIVDAQILDAFRPGRAITVTFVSGRRLLADDASAGLAEDDGLVAIEQHPVFEVPPHRAGERLALDVAAY